MDLKSTLARTGKTQSQIAREIGVTAAYVSQVINGKRLIGPDLLLKFSQALCVEPRDLRPDLAALFQGEPAE